MLRRSCPAFQYLVFFSIFASSLVCALSSSSGQNDEHTSSVVASADQTSKSGINASQPLIDDDHKIVESSVDKSAQSTKLSPDAGNDEEADAVKIDDPRLKLSKTDNSSAGKNESTISTAEKPAAEISNGTNSSTSKPTTSETSSTIKDAETREKLSNTSSERDENLETSSASTVLPASSEKSNDTGTNDPPQPMAAQPLASKTDVDTGIVALVMAIVFAVVVIIVYFGLLAWRHYLEYRYGNRELLVNDLEFDTNDLRHFEL